MLRSQRIMIIPTPEQEKYFWRASGVARWVYNQFLTVIKNSDWDREKSTYFKWLSELRKTAAHNLVLLSNTENFSWLKEVGSRCRIIPLRDLVANVMCNIKAKRRFPKYKTKRNSKPTFPMNNETFHPMKGGFHGERLGFVKTKRKLPDAPKYYNPRISFDGWNWYISFSFDVEKEDVELTDESIGIDLGIKNLAVLSNGKIYGNINKCKRVKQLKKRLARAQRKLSRKLEFNTKSRDDCQRPSWARPLDDCKNFQKQKKFVALLFRQLSNIRRNYLHQTTCEIVKTKPSRIVLEDLKVQQMNKNRNLSEAIMEQCWREFRWQIEYKSERYGIAVVIADRKFPSSQRCHVCGSLNRKTKNLRVRKWTCEHCGTTHDRDLNAALNLASYEL